MKLSLLSTVRNSRYYYIWLASLSGILLSLGWIMEPLAFFLLFAFVPLLRIEAYITERESRKPGPTFFLYAYITMLIWNVITTWWIYNSTAVGGIFAMLANSLLLCIPLVLFRYVKSITNEKFGYFCLVFFWIAFEYVHLNWDLTWPWLTLGNGFMFEPEWVQWYEYTGVLGGSLWVWMANFAVYFALLRHKGPFSTFSKIESDFVALAVILTPILYSYYMYNTYEETGKEVEFVVVQPNIDPYTEKFAGTENFIPFEEQLERFIQLTESQITPNTRFVLWPETAIDGVYPEESVEDIPIIQRIKAFNQQYPQMALLTGITSYRQYPGTPTPTARYREDMGFYDIFNTAIFLEENKPIQFYHKSKLVPGVEMMPYPIVFGLLQSLVIDMGGTSGGLGTQPDRAVFTDEFGNQIGPVICFESIYGEFVTGYVRNGADFLTVITNDGWWGNTPGHRQHLAFSSLRAIETRRSIARSANTGISGFINQRGEIMYPTNYWESDVVNATIRANDKRTFYVQYGDYIGRGAGFLAPFLLLSALTKRFIARRKSVTARRQKQSRLY